MGRTSGLPILCLVLLGIVPNYGQEIPDSVKNLFSTHMSWGTPAMAKPSNATLTLRESYRSGGVIKYRLIAEGLPSEAVYAIVAWPVTSPAPAEAIRGVTLDASGMAVCAGTKDTCQGNRPNDPIDLAFQPVQGEPIRMALVSTDGQAMAAVKLVPLPLRGTDHGCKVDAVLVTPGGEAVLIEGSGFRANAEIAFESNSEGEVMNSKAKADADGHYSTALLPFVKGRTKGTANVRLKTAECSPSVRVPWGKR